MVVSLASHVTLTLKHIFEPMLLDCQLFRKKDTVLSETKLQAGALKVVQR